MSTMQTIPTPQPDVPVHSGNGAELSKTGDESSKLEKRCHELLSETQRLRDELATVQAERDQFKKTIYCYLRKEMPVPTFTENDILAAARTEPTFGELIAELEREYGAES